MILRKIFIRFGGLIGGFGCSFIGSEFAGEAGAWIGALSFCVGLLVCLALLNALLR